METCPSFEALDQLSAELLPERAMLGGIVAVPGGGGAGAAGASSSSAASGGGAVGGGGGFALNSCTAVTQPDPNLLSVLGLSGAMQTTVTCVPGAVAVT